MAPVTPLALRASTRPLAVLASTAATGLLLLVAAPVAAAVDEPAPCARPTAFTYTEQGTWPMQRLAPSRLHPLATGAGQTVALIGMEVDTGNVQLSDAVTSTVRVGKDNTPHSTDCSGTGTLAAGLIAAAPDPTGTTPVAGLAPGVQLVPIMVGDAPKAQQSVPTPAQLTLAFDAAVKARADVICVVAASNETSPALEAAVRRALAADVVVVVAGSVTTSPGQASGPTYPTAYPDVLAVVGVAQDDRPVSGADDGSYVDIAAPATRIWSTGPVPHGSQAFNHVVIEVDPTAAAAYVAATAALVRQAYPQLSRTEVSDRILATADVAAGGHPWGVLDPYRALTEVLTARADTIVARPGHVMPLLPPEGVSAATRIRAAAIVTGSVGATVTAVALTAAARRGRRRRLAGPEGSGLAGGGQS